MSSILYTISHGNTLYFYFSTHAHTNTYICSHICIESYIYIDIYIYIYICICIDIVVAYSETLIVERLVAYVVVDLDHGEVEICCFTRNLVPVICF